MLLSSFVNSLDSAIPLFVKYKMYHHLDKNRKKNQRFGELQIYRCLVLNKLSFWMGDWSEFPFIWMFWDHADIPPEAVDNDKKPDLFVSDDNM